MNAKDKKRKLTAQQARLLAEQIREKKLKNLERAREVRKANIEAERAKPLRERLVPTERMIDVGGASDKFFSGEKRQERELDKPENQFKLTAGQAVYRLPKSSKITVCFYLTVKGKRQRFERDIFYESEEAALIDVQRLGLRVFNNRAEFLKWT